MNRKKIIEIKYEGEYFNVKDTLECGQIFRYYPFDNGYFVMSKNHPCFCYNQGDFAYIKCYEEDREYFYNYFDLDRDYKKIVESAKSFDFGVLKHSAELGKGIRILNQDILETLFSFIISQNNNIPRIKKIIEKGCESLGDKITFLDKEFYTFFDIEKLSKKDLDFCCGLGLGYRASYIKNLAENIVNGFDAKSIKDLSTSELKKQLLKLYGVGPKVADCVLLFGYKKTDSFPVDTWIEKVYFEDFNGKLKDRNKITEYFVNLFKGNSGYFQQYLFYYKRSLEKK